MTVMESGVPQFNVTTWMAVFAPANVPKAIVDRLNREIVSAMTSEAGKALAVKDAVDLVASTPEEFATFMRAESDKWARVIKAGGVKVE